jgi:hypothetical protein
MKVKVFPSLYANTSQKRREGKYSEHRGDRAPRQTMKLAINSSFHKMHKRIAYSGDRLYPHVHISRSTGRMSTIFGILHPQ